MRDVKNSCCWGSHNFALARATAPLPQRTSENDVLNGTLVGRPRIASLKKAPSCFSVLVSSGHESEAGAIVYNFKFASNKAVNGIV